MMKHHAQNWKPMLLLALALHMLASGCLSTPQPLDQTAFLPNMSNRPAGAGNTGPPSDFTGTKIDVGTGKLGQVVCTLNGIINSSMTIYIQENNVRSEYFLNDMSKPLVSLAKGDDYYMSGGVEGTPFENCTWVRFDKDGYNTSAANLSGTGFSIPNLTSMEKPKCRPGSFDAEIFEISGTVCNFTEIMAQFNARG